MRVLICGDRNWTNKMLIKDAILELADLATIECIIEGEAKGADSLARIVGEELGIPVIKFPADWHSYGRAAGYIRNQQMLTEGRPDTVVAFHNCISQSKGTKNMIMIAKKAGKIVYLITEEKKKLEVI